MALAMPSQIIILNLQTTIDNKIATRTAFNVHKLLQYFTIDITTSLVFGYQETH